jgi:hypothetical protein
MDIRSWENTLIDMVPPWPEQGGHFYCVKTGHFYCRSTPLSFHAYVAANCHTALANLPHVDAKRIGVMGHSYCGKWAMFAACLYDKFACGAWSDPGIVFDEKRSNVIYWEPWYLGYEPGRERTPGIPTEKNSRTGAYKELIEAGHDLHELHALMAPRPLLISGGSEDPPGRWKALNHAVAVNNLLGYKDRVGMTNRKTHAPTEESSELNYLFFEHVPKDRPPKGSGRERNMVRQATSRHGPSGWGRWRGGTRPPPCGTCRPTVDTLACRPACRGCPTGPYQRR